MVTTDVSVRLHRRMVYSVYALLALFMWLWTTPAAAVYLTVTPQLEYFRTFSGSYSINLRRDGVVRGDALIYSLAVSPFIGSPATNISANGMCIQFTVNSSNLARDFSTSVLSYSVTYEGPTGERLTDGGFIDLRTSNNGLTPPNTQDCGTLPEINHIPSFNSTIAAQVAPGSLFSRDLSSSVSDADTADVLTVSLAPNTVARYGTANFVGNVLNYTANTNVPSGSTEILGLVVSDGRGGTGTSSASFTINTAPTASVVSLK